MTEATEQSTDRARARVGATVDGKWHLDSLLGIGGMAAVYAGTHRNGTRGAIKVLNPEIALNDGAKTRFLREGYVANKIGHPRVVLVLDDDEAPDGTVYLVMELLEGETLHAIIADGRRLPAMEVLRIAHDVLEVLEVAHAKDVIHRDLKPGNLMLAPDGAVKLLDFGVAKVKESTVEGIPNVTTLSAIGTPGFMPPEQARGRWDSVDGRADVWALGATMFALLTCRYVHEEETPNEQLLAAMTKPAPRLREVMPEASPIVASIVDRALAFDREERYASAASMRSAVASAMRDLAELPPPVDASEATPATPARVAATPMTDGAAVSDVGSSSRARARDETGKVAGGRPARPALGFVAAGIAAVVVVAFVVRSGSRDAPATPPPSGAASTAEPPAPPIPAIPASAGAPSAVSTATEPSSAAMPSVASAASATSAAPVMRGATPPARPPPQAVAKAAPAASVGTAAPAVAPSAAPATSVDIFNRRH